MIENSFYDVLYTDFIKLFVKLTNISWN